MNVKLSTSSVFVLVAVVAACTSSKMDSEVGGGSPPGSATTVTQVVETAAPETTPAPTTTAEACINGSVRKEGEERQRCDRGQWVEIVFVAPTTTLPEPMDIVTWAWWNGQDPDLQQLGCSVGFEMVSATYPNLDQATFRRLCDGERPPRGENAPFTVEDLNAVLGPPAAAWVANPSAPAYDALAAAAFSIASSGSSLDAPELVDPFGARSAGMLIAQLQSYPGSDNAVYHILHDLALNIPLPFMLHTGSYRVGLEVPPGTYRAEQVQDCYWETLDEAGEINDNNFVSSAPQVLMTVRSSDYAVNNECGIMFQIG